MVGALLTTGGLIAVVSGGGKPHRPAQAGPSLGGPARAPPIQPAAPAKGLSWHTPPTVVASGTPVQEEYDQAFAQGLGSQAGMIRAESLPVPAPAVAGRLAGRSRAASTPEGWAAEFVAGLLDINFAGQSRPALAAWLQAQEAPELIPGIPATVADKVLYISLLDPGLFGGQPTPVVSAEAWGDEARAGVRQTVSGLLVEVDPAWSQLIAAGWQPADVRMTEVDVSGVLTRAPGRAGGHPPLLRLAADRRERPLARRVRHRRGGGLAGRRPVSCAPWNPTGCASDIAKSVAGDAFSFDRPRLRQRGRFGGQLAMGPDLDRGRSPSGRPGLRAGCEHRGGRRR